MSIEETVFMARVADQAERYDDMVDFLQKIVQTKDSDLSVEERNLLSVGFKNLIGGRRAAFRTVTAIEQNSKYAQFSDDCKAYKEKIQNELVEQCDKVISIVRDDCIPKSSEDESKSFYLKMIGDYYRYMAEVLSGDKLNEIGDKALDFYGQADLEAQKLPVCNSIRLGLALNFSVFYYEVKSDSKKACEIAQTALDHAKEDIDSVGNDEAKDALSIVELLKENLDLWKEAEEEGAEDEGAIDL